MKFLMVIVLVLVCIWLWRTHRPQLPRANKPMGKPTGTLDMVSCAHCSVHVPSAEAVQGKKGLYCSEEHRQRAEG